MKRTFKLTLIILTLIGCTSNVELLPQAAAITQVTEIVPVSVDPTWSVYDPDPAHIWNRVFRQFYRRTTRDGKEYGLGLLDPLLWPDTAYLLRTSNEQAMQVLDEFLTTHAEDLIQDPLKRALFQRDLWAVFDWLAFQADAYPSQRRQTLETRLAEIIKSVSLTMEQITSLPDNYALAVQSNTFPGDHLADNPKAAFLPHDLFEPDDAWVPMGREGGPIAMAHTEGFPFFGRSVFLVFIRSPDGRTATLDFIASLNTESRPALATGSDVALVRRMLLIDDQGNLVLSPLVETIQIRHFNPEQIFHEFELDRVSLFNGHANVFNLKTELFMLFFSHGDVFEFHDIPSFQATIPDICKACHVNIPAVIDRGHIQSILSYSRANFPLPDNRQPILFATTWTDEAQTVIHWKTNHKTWNSLKTLWDK